MYCKVLYTVMCPVKRKYENQFIVVENAAPLPSMVTNIAQRMTALKYLKRDNMTGYGKHIVFYNAQFSTGHLVG